MRQSFLKNSPAELTKQIAVGDCIVEVDKYDACSMLGDSSMMMIPNESSAKMMWANESLLQPPLPRTHPRCCDSMRARLTLLIWSSLPFELTLTVAHACVGNGVSWRFHRETVEGWTLSELAERILGPNGSVVECKFRRKYVSL